MKWKTISIFISSTFNDMQAERDYIRKYVVPRLNEELEQHRVVVQTVDLRWGVDTRDMDEGAREAKVLHVCMDAIKHTRPYFVALLGNRYGWVPSFSRIAETISHLDECDRALLKEVAEEKSVTELEIIFGVMGSKDLVKHSFFCLRSMDSYQGMSKDDFTQISDNNALYADKLEKLLDRIRDLADEKKADCEIIEYTAKWNPSSGSFEDLQEFGDDLFNAIFNDIKADMDELERSDSNTDSAYDSEMKALENFISFNTRDFIGRKHLIEEMRNFFVGHTDIDAMLNGKRGLFLVGTSGCGKSYLFSALYNELSAYTAEKRFLLLAHAAGITPKSKSVHAMLDNWCRQLKTALGEEVDDVSHQYNKDDFRDLCALSQVKGYHPIVLIDSLDNFVNDKLLSKWDFIPANVPFICTTLPGYAEDIIKQNTRYAIKNIDNFSREDALLLINYFFYLQHKELSQANIDRLLAIADNNGTPSHSSPLWLKIALTILSEFGASDFREIHNCMLQGEDYKIDNYLKNVIEQMPPTPESLFNHFVAVSCRYFSPELTKEVMSYIAISEYGLSELHLERLLGEKWNHLEFVSLRYWLKGIIAKNGLDDRWVFTHAIFKQQMQCYDSEYIASLRENLMGLLVDEADKDNGNVDEFVFQAVAHGAYHDFYYYLEQLSDNSKSISTTAVARSMLALLLHYEEMTLAFLEGYMSLYYSCSRYDDAIYWFETLLSEIDYYVEEPERKKQLLLQMYPLSFRFFTDADVYNGDGKMFANYLYVHEAYFDYVDYNDMYDEYDAAFTKVRDAYFRNKEKYGKAIRNIEFYNFYRRWILYNASLSRRCRSNEDLIPKYYDSFSRVIDELEWFVNGAEFPLDNVLDVYRCFVSSFGRLNFALSLSELQGLALRMHTNYTDILHWIDPSEFDDKNSYFLNKFDSVAEDLIDAYVKRHDGEEFPQTPLLEIYNVKYDSAENSVPENDESYYDCTDVELNVGTISFGNIADLDSFNDDAGTHDVDDEDSPDDEATDVAEDAEALEDALNRYISQNIRKFDNDEFDSEIFQRYFEELLHIINLYSVDGNKEKVASLIRNNIALLSTSIYNLPNNYAVLEDHINLFISLGRCYGNNGYNDEQIKMLESLRDVLWQSYYHHIDGDAQFQLFYEIEEVYRKYGLEQQLLEHLEKRFEIACRYHIEHKYNYFFCYYSDLGYVRPIYYKLLKQQHKLGLVSDAVLTIEKWLRMCDIAYCDNDGGYKDEDYSGAYEALAMLYDGTPKILSGMKERGSIFLCDPLIMVEYNNKWGYVTHDGEIAIPCIYDSASRIKDYVAEVHDGNSWQDLSVDRKYICDAHSSLDCADTTLSVEEYGDKKGFADTRGNIVIEPKYMYCRPFYWGVAAVSAPSGGLSNNRWGFVDTDGNEIVPHDRYNDVGDFREGLAWVSDGKSSGGLGFKGSKFGFINTKGELVIPMIYDDASSFFEGRAMVYVGDQCMYIDKEGNVI